MELLIMIGAIIAAAAATAGSLRAESRAGASDRHPATGPNV